MKHTPSLLAIALTLTVALGTAASAQPDLRHSLTPRAQPLPPDQAFGVQTRWQGDRLIVTMDIAKGYYLYGDRLTLSPDAPRVEASPTQSKQDPNFGQVEIWQNHARVVFAPVNHTATLSWQGCEEAGLCYPPQARQVVPPAASASPPTGPLQTETPQAVLPPTAPALADTAQTGIPAKEASGLVASLGQSGGALWVVVAFFGFGLALAFTPCVLPMVPIVAAMIGTRIQGITPRRGLGLATVYVLAMALAFALIGAVAAVSGANLQILLQQPLAVGLMAGVFVLLGLGSFGLFTMQMPQALAARVGQIAPRPGSPARAALLGFSSALIIGPCVTAPLAGALLYIAQSGDVVLGMGALFALGLGQGMPLLAVGLFGASILPRMGPWTGLVNRAMGLLFLALAIWLLGRILPGPLTLALWAVLLLGLGGSLLGRGAGMGNALAAIALCGGALQGVGAALGGTDPLQPLAALQGRTERPLTEDAAAAFQAIGTPEALDAALAHARQTRLPTLIYVTADWCTSCRTIDRKVLTDPAIRHALQNWQRLVVDVSHLDQNRQALMTQLAVIGPPTMIFVTPEGETRLLGEITADQLHSALAAHPS
ncbi:protein-disulfide reductase DsbD (plasmid) [Thioclava litoralis]|uniref:Protein-disulfide reductase DsbD n=1 Tax=Thioclava litoralis TaxID=3076557 RepID=A0ABZ1E5F9_9RHOB|nr:protein-disulfide reductase DsbD [Thioclava sp. FTW29]